MGWLIELLLEAIKEKCSQFLIDMMELVTQMFTELLSCDLSLFEELFGVVGDLYKNVMVPMVIALLLLICVWQLFKSMFGRMGMSREDPIELVCRSGVRLFMIVGAKTAVDYILGVAGTPYQWVIGTSIEVNSFSEYVSAMEGVTAALGIDSISVMLLMLIMQFVVAWNYFKMLFVIAERYVLLGVFSYTAPLAFATGGSRATNSILSSWVKMFGGQIVLIIMNAWCMKMFLSGYGNMLASGYGFTKFFVATLCLIGFCKITFKLDSYMASLGVNLGRPSSGLGAMGLLMAAGRILGHVEHGSSPNVADGTGSSAGTAAGAAAGMAAQGMAQSTGGPIPMGVELLGGAGEGEMFEESAEASGETGFEDDMEAQAEAMDAMENDNVLEALGEMPDENMAEGMAFDEDGAGESIAGFEQQVGDMELDGTEQMQDMPEEGTTEMFSEENGIDGLGDYPVNREEEQEEGETLDGEMDLDGTIPSEETDMGEVTCGSAGSAMGENASFTSGSMGASGQNADSRADILEELGGGVSAAPTDMQVEAGAEAESEFFEAASGGMGSTSQSRDKSMQAANDETEARFFDTSGNAEGFQPQENISAPGQGYTDDRNIEPGQIYHEETPEGNLRMREGYHEDFYGEIPDVPKSREDLKNWKNQPGHDQDELL